MPRLHYYQPPPSPLGNARAPLSIECVRADTHVTSASINAMAVQTCSTEYGSVVKYGRHWQSLFIAIFTCTMLTSARADAQELVEYYGHDAIGSVRVTFDQLGGVTSRIDQSPFGSDGSSGSVAEQFVGQKRDVEIGLDYFNARMLQPRLGRFTSADPLAGNARVPQSWNRYAYSFQNPLSFSDRTGLVVSVDTHCSQTAGAYWCPGSITFDPKYVPSDNPLAWGYHGGELAQGEQRYQAFVGAKIWARETLAEIAGPGEVHNATGHTILKKDEDGKGTGLVSPRGTQTADGAFDPEHPGEFVPISNGVRVTIANDGKLTCDPNTAVSLLMSTNYDNTLGGALGGYVMGAIGYGLTMVFDSKNKWTPIDTFRHQLSAGDDGWDNFFHIASGQLPWPSQ